MKRSGIAGKKHRITAPQLVINIILGFCALICIVPVLNMIAVSLSEASVVNAAKVYLWPVKITTAAYAYIAKEGTFGHSFMISVERVLVFVPLSMVLTLMMAYPLSKGASQFRFQKPLMWVAVFTMLFGGGLIPTFMLVRSLGLLNNFFALVLPGAVSVYNMILMVNFFRGLPRELDESAYMDGANPWTILWRIYVPISKPSIATIALFTIVGVWNDFFSGLIYMNRMEKYPLQTYLYSLSLKLDFVKTTDINELIEKMKIAGLNFNAAKIVLSMIPILIIYPFLQKYFVTGLVLGSVKE